MTPKAQELWDKLRAYAPDDYGRISSNKTQIELAFEWTCEHLAAIYERLDSISGQVSVLNVATSELAKKAHRAEQPAEAGKPDLSRIQPPKGAPAAVPSKPHYLEFYEVSEKKGYEVGLRECIATCEKVHELLVDLQYVPRAEGAMDCIEHLRALMDKKDES